MAGHVDPKGFREYDARWRFPEQVDLPGLVEVGQAIGTQMQARGVPPQIIVGHDSRSYSQSVKEALCKGLVAAGITVHDIGLCLTPMAYFARDHVGIDAVAMITASHNPNGWTGVKLGFHPPGTHGPDDMRELREIWQSRIWSNQPDGSLCHVQGVKQAYLNDLTAGDPLRRRLRVVCATGNGTAGAFAPEMLRRLGVDVIELHTALDTSFPHYNPNPEALEMLEDMAQVVRKTGADIAIGLDGDGDRCGVVDHLGQEVFADKVGLLLARDIARKTPDARFVVDIKSTGLFATDPVLRAHGASVEYWKTGHSHMKKRVHELRADAGFEKSGHYFFGKHQGRGYDCGLRAALAICQMMAAHPTRSLADLVADLPASWTSPTMSADCADDIKYERVATLSSIAAQLLADRGDIGGRKVTGLSTINGVRIQFADGAWALVRASSNTPTLVVVCESMTSRDDLHQLFQSFDAFIRQVPGIGAYDQQL